MYKVYSLHVQPLLNYLYWEECFLKFVIEIDGHNPDLID
jgi:hypothetical protein